MIHIESKAAQRIQWILIEQSNEKYSQLKKLERTDLLGLHIKDRATLMILIQELNALIESLIESTFGSSKYATIKGEK